MATDKEYNKKNNQSMIKDRNMQKKLSAVNVVDLYMQDKYFSNDMRFSNKPFLEWMEKDYSAGKKDFKKQEMPYWSAFFNNQKGKDLISSYEEQFVKFKKEGKIKEGTPAYYQFSEKDYESYRDELLNLPNWNPQLSKESEKETDTKTIEDRIMNRMQIIDKGGLY
tara:strand:- start:293 stop:790 length:498 start_codon:yes stop_codon:yes gene_type:complete